MNVVATIAEAREALREARHAGKRIGFVPTMGYLHRGHLALVAEAKRRTGVAVVSIFVNPLQFGPNEDFARYPRDAERDLTLAGGAGADLVFMPTTEEMYAAEASAMVVPRRAAERWEGAVRPGHFAGVLTVVAKLFNIVQPDVAVFGQKDVQQATLVQGMIRSLDFPIELVVLPTVREEDGLAMSSRNAYLVGDDRVRALALAGALRAVDAAWRRGASDPRELEAIGLAVLDGTDGVTPDYFALVAPETLEPAAKATDGTIVIVAARVGPTRLIDNMRLGGPAPSTMAPTR
jgi:pantoate--beta-alanine ligase